MSAKAAERSTLLLHLGHALAPVRRLAEAAVPPFLVEYRMLAAQFEPDISRWENEYGKYATVAGVYFRRERDALKVAADSLCKWIGHAGDKTDPAEAQATLRDALKRAEAEFIRLIDQIPIEWEPHLAAAKTPFTTCLMIADAISGAQRRVDYFDRYLDPDFFPLYLRKLRRNVAIKLITTRGNAQYGVVAVQALARLAAQEFSAFNLVECAPTDLHDRNVRVDDEVFHLRTSTNAAGRYPPNFTPGDSTSHGHQVLDDIIAAGTVVI